MESCVGVCSLGAADPKEGFVVATELATLSSEEDSVLWWDEVGEELPVLQDRKDVRARAGVLRDGPERLIIRKTSKWRLEILEGERRRMLTFQQADEIPCRQRLSAVFSLHPPCPKASLYPDKAELLNTFLLRVISGRPAAKPGKTRKARESVVLAMKFSSRAARVGSDGRR